MGRGIEIKRDGILTVLQILVLALLVGTAAMTPEQEEAAGWLAQARAAVAEAMREQAARPNWGETRWAGPVPLPGAESNLGAFMSMAPWALAAMRAGAPRGPAARATGMKETPRKPNGEEVVQQVYEAMLGRTRRPGEHTGQPGSGWWKVAGQPIPKPTNVLPHIIAGGVGYGVYNAMGGPEAWRALRDQPWKTPGTPEYAKAQAQRNAYIDGVHQRGDPLELLANYGHSMWPDTSGSRGVPVLDDQSY